MKDIIKLNTGEKLLFASIFAGLLLWLLFAPPIAHRGEAREGLVVQGILHHQQWILPYRNGQLPSKPPLFHWVAATGALIFGESDFSMRLPSAIGAGIMVIVTFLLGRSMAGKLTGWLAIGALLGIYDFWTAARQARVDMIFGACVTAAVAGFFFWYRDSNRSARAACYVATVCAVLTKGPLGIALVGLVIVGFLAVEHQLRLVWKFRSWPLVSLSLTVICGWYGLAYAIGGERFLALQLAYENVHRFVGGDDFPRRQMYLNMLFWLATQTLPWNLVLLWSALQWLRGRREDSAGRMLHSWWMAMFAFFVLAAHTRPVYFLPMFPAIALLAARAINAVIASTVFTTPRTEMTSSPELGRHSRQLVLWIGAAIVLCDLTEGVINYRAGHKDKHGNARVAFQKLLNPAITVGQPLYATPEVASDDVMVLSYRLRRSIQRRPLSCVARPDYFLTTIDQKETGNAQVLASLRSANLALVTGISAAVPTTGAECVAKSKPDPDNDDS